MLRRYTFKITYLVNIITMTEETKIYSINAFNDLDAFTELCQTNWYQGLNYNQKPIVTMFSEDLKRY